MQDKPFEPVGSLDSGHEPRLKYPTYKRFCRLESAYVRRSNRPSASWLSSTLNLSRLLPWPSHREPSDLSTGAGRIDCNTFLRSKLGRHCERRTLVDEAETERPRAGGAVCGMAAG